MMKKIKILVSDPLAEEGLKILKRHKNFAVDERSKLSPDEFKKIIPDYDALIVRSGSKVTADIIGCAKKLKVIGRAGVGLDNVDVEAASKKGIVVMNAPSGNTVSTAEHTMSLILALARNIPQADASLRQNRWERKKFKGIELYKKTLGIVGLGRIGMDVARRAMAFGMKVIANDPYLSKEKAQALEITLMTFDQLLKESDFITLHTPLTKDIIHMLSEKEFKKMKRGVRIINCARGGVLDENALVKALTSGKVGGCALDVYEKEPPLNHPLLKLDNVVITPHLGASTEEAQINVAIDIARQVSDALLNQGVRNAVNVPAVDPEALKQIKPYIELADKMGLLMGQLAKGHINQVKIRYRGDVTAHKTAPISVTLLKGLLTPILGETVNYVNAPVMARERGIKVVESKITEIENFANLIGLEVHTEDKTYSVAGSLFGKDSARIVMINEYHVEVIPTGYMLLIRNLDKPGVIGQIGSLLGKNKINIANMTFGREKRGGDALTVLSIDSEISDAILKQIKKAKNIIDVKIIKF